MPISASATPVFHESYASAQQLPNFLRGPKLTTADGDVESRRAA